MLAASAEVLPLQLSMLVVMVMLLLMMMMLVKVRVVRSGRTGVRHAAGSPVDDVFRRAFVDDVRVVTVGGAVVVAIGQMLG